MKKKPETSNKKCMSPWVGLLVILAVCVLLSSAIFWSTRSEKHRPQRGPTGESTINVHYVPYGTPVPTDPAPGTADSEPMLIF